MARGRPYRFARFARGLNTADGPYGLREGYEDDPSGLGSEARQVMNVVSKRRGNISKRDGSIQLFETVTPASVFFKDLSTIGNDGNSFALASTTTGILYAISTALVRTSLATGLSNTAKWTFLRLPTISAQGPAFGMNGTDTPRETDGTLGGTGNWTAVSGTLKNGTLLEYHENTLWVSGVAAEPYSLFWSSVGDPTAWPAANVTKFNPDGGLPITALCSIGPYLLVFKERGIWSVYNAETSANRKFADGAGTLSPRSVVSTPEGCFFLDPERGVMVTDGNDVKRQFLGHKLCTTLNKFYIGRRRETIKVEQIKKLIEKLLTTIGIGNNAVTTLMHEIDAAGLFHPMTAPVVWSGILRGAMEGDIDEAIKTAKFLGKRERHGRDWYDDSQRGEFLRRGAHDPTMFGRGRSQ